MTVAPDNPNGDLRPRSDLGLRTASAVVLAAVVLGATAVGGPPFALLWLLAALAVGFEWLSVARVASPLTLGVGAVGLVASTIVATQPSILAVVVALSVVALAATSSSGARRWTTAGFLYAAVVVVVPVAVRTIPDFGLALVLWMFAVVWTTDVVAYFVGRALGGPKLWPRVSPKKTWSGFLGGVGAASFAGYAVSAIAGARGVPVPASAPVIGLASAAAAAASQAGDLAESAMKRHFGVKDSGRLIPGHGGVMDRLDGFVAVLALVGLGLAVLRLAER